MAAILRERELSADAGALGFVASNDSLVFIVLWCEVAAALVLSAAFILNPDPIPAATITPKDVHDRSSEEPNDESINCNSFSTSLIDCNIFKGHTVE